MTVFFSYREEEEKTNRYKYRRLKDNLFLGKPKRKKKINIYIATGKNSKFFLP